jgi:PadR family transcriptional regulator PadR
MRFCRVLKPPEPSSILSIRLGPLQTLLLGPAHGHTIAHIIEHRYDNALEVEHGSLYPALHHLEVRGWLSSSWDTSENNQRARYHWLAPI